MLVVLFADLLLPLLVSSFLVHQSLVRKDNREVEMLAIRWCEQIL